MSFIDELKKLTHPYEDEDEEFEDFEDDPRRMRLRTAGPKSRTAATRW